METQRKITASSFIGTMKVFLLSALVASLIIPSTICRAETQYSTIPFNKAFGGQYGIAFGNWYDSNGDLVLTIDGNGTINGYKVLSVGYTGDSVAFYKVRIADGNSIGEVYLAHFGQGYHDTLILNEKIALRNSQKARYVESVGGVYLGMNKNQLVALYGQPSVKGEEGRNEAWTYNKEGFRVCFDRATASVINSITIFPNGNRRFDGTGLSARDSLQTFISGYSATPYGRRMYSIGHGEGIYQRDGNITLFALESY